MLRKTLPPLGLLLSVFLLHAAAAEEKLPPASQWVPQDAVIAVEIAKPKALLDAVLDEKVTKAVKAVPLYQKAVEQPGFQQFLQVVSFLEMQVGTDWKTALHKLVDGGVTWAVTPNGGSLLIVDSTDEKLLKQLHEIILNFVKQDAANKGEADRIASADYQGVTGWTMGGGDAHAIIGSRLLLTNKADLLKAAIDLRKGGQSLGASAAFQAAKRAAGEDAVATAFVDMATIKKNPAVAKALKHDPNPMAALLFAGLFDAVQQSDWLGMKLKVEGTTLSLQVQTDKARTPSSEAAFTWPKQPDEGALPNLSVPRMIAGLSFYRDLHGFYTAKDKLFPERTSGLIFFENMMGIFFSGRDLSEEVLAEAKPETRFVVAAQKYDPAIGIPQVQIPAFAAIFRVRHPKEFADVMESAWQKAVGLVSFTRGQKAELGLVIDRPSYQGVQFSTAYFPTSGIQDKTRLSVHFNFRPSLAMLGDYVVLSSTDGLAKDLIDAIKKEQAQPAKPLAGKDTLVQVSAVQVAEMLDANRENLISQNMVEKGNTREQAETETGVLRMLVRALGQATLTIESRQPSPRVDFELKLNLK